MTPYKFSPYKFAGVGNVLRCTSFNKFKGRQGLSVTLTVSNVFHALFKLGQTKSLAAELILRSVLKMASK